MSMDAKEFCFATNASRKKRMPESCATFLEFHKKGDYGTPGETGAAGSWHTRSASMRPLPPSIAE
jgi:hypothetical protein